uniref:Arrestin_C domain-containing protein n=2 Tax=Trichobilharzia regenti TaxID=157069 RepID=A0AA85J022_TRIRE|nr:unnamed protein product [Trichobilharzia regenti]
MDMKCQKSKSYEIEINIENELGVFEPRDDVAGHILIKADEDTEIDSCILWLYGLTKTRWNVQSENHTTQPGSLASGINLLRSTSNFNRLNNSTTTYITENKFCKLLSNASSVLRKTTTSKLQDNSFRLPLRTCCTDQGYLSDTHYKSSCNYNHSSCFLDREINGERRIGGSWISGSGSFNSSLDAESSIKSFHSLGKFGYYSGVNNFADFSLRSSQQFTMRNQLYDAGCLPSFCLEQWKKLFEVDPDKKKCLYNGDLQLIYKSKLDLLKQHQQYLSGKSKDKGDNSTRNGTTEILKVIHHDNSNDDNLDKSYNDKESSSEPINSEEKINRGVSQRYQHNTGTKYHELLNITNEKSQTSTEKNIKLKPKFILTRGIHVFDFEFQLPADLPGSFELPSSCLAGGASASITYAVRIEIYSNRSKMKHVQQREIIVFRPLELIHFPRLRDRITLHREFVSLGCCSNPSGIILCDLAVNKTGFVPGETIIPQVHITNRSSRAIQTVHLTFAQTVFLKGVNNQNHFEVLRIFATKLNAQPAALGFDLFDQLDVNSLGGLFSPSNSFSSRSSANRVDRIQQQEHQLCNVNAKQHSKDAESHSNQRQKSRKRHQHHSSSTNVVAVPSQGGKAFFTDLIHVPPLPTSGLFGRQSLIYLEYSLILRLRMQGDKEGKHDHCMQIPITIGSDPTRETSFTGNNEVVPCYASFNFASGDIVEYDPSDQTTAMSLTPVYRYFKPKPIEKPVNKSNITFSSESPVNSNSIKSVQITSKSSPSILKTPGTSGVPTDTGTGASTTRDNRQNSFKSNKPLCDNENIRQVPRNFHRQQDKQLKNTTGSPDMNKASFTTLYNSDGAKSDSCSYKQTQNKIRKHTSSYKLKHQNNFQDVTPQKTHISRSAGVISTPTDLDKESPQVFLSSQQFFDDGGVIIQNDSNESGDATDRLFKSCRLNKNDTIILPVDKSKNLSHQSGKHHQLKNPRENDVEDHLSSNIIQKKHPHTSPLCFHYLGESGLGYKCKSQTNIPLRQHSAGLLSDQQLQFDNTENFKSVKHQSNEPFQQYSPNIIKPNPVHYDVDDDNNDEVENNEGDEDEEDNIPYESNTDDITSDEINRFTFKASHFYLSSNDNLKQCTERPFNSDNLSTRNNESSSVSSENEDEDEDEEEEYDDDEEGEDEEEGEEEDYADSNVVNNQCIYEEDASENKDGSQLDDNKEESERQYRNQRQNEKQEPLKQSAKISHEELHSQSSSSPNHTSVDIRELYFKVQQISEHKNIPANYTFKQNKSIYDAYWNCPKVEPIVGRKSETDGFWTYGHGNTSEKTTESNETST